MLSLGLTALMIVAAYLVGSFSAAVVVCKLLGLPDPRTVGSGNPGATNVLRMGGKKAAALTLLLDIGKGVIPVLLARWLLPEPWQWALVALAAYFGHLFPVFFRFQGGKGVATAFGVLVALSWPVGLLVLATWLLAALITRYSSVGALTAAGSAPLYMAWLSPHLALVGCALVITLVTTWRHRSNIRNLWHGKEDKIGAKRDE